jgi:hypothetical protein
MEYLEIVSPADFKTVDMPPATDKVPVTPWKQDVLPRGVNLCRRPLAAADRVAAGCSSAHGGDADI